MQSFTHKLDPAKIPQHVCIIMDGNGRWAKKRSLPRTKGHLEGLKAAKEAVKTASDLDIKYLSLYVFSTENWKRTQEEVTYLMFLIKRYLKNEFPFYKKNQIRILHSGNAEGLPKDIVKSLDQIKRKTKYFRGLTLNLAINYGGRDEILRAFNRWIKSNNGKKEITIEEFLKNLDQPEIPDPDLIIRTGGEIRTSNFLLWQSAYAELFFTNKLWPDWKKEDFIIAIENFQKRERRFGGVK